MKGKIRSRIEKTCPHCGREVIIYEINDSSPCSCYDSALCPACNEKIHEDYIVGEFETVLKETSITNKDILNEPA